VPGGSTGAYPSSGGAAKSRMSFMLVSRLMKLKSAIGKTVRGLIGAFGYQILPKGIWYMDCKTTVDSARQVGLSVPNYVAQLWDEQGVVEDFVKYISALIPLSKCSRILEIGTGTGRFLEPIARVANPASYDVYETSPDWSAYIARTYPFTTMNKADGSSLRGTPDASQDLVHAHCVFVYLPVSTSFGYFLEMARVCAPGGFVVFDCFLADRQTLELIEICRANGIKWQIILPREAICDLFSRQGFEMVDSNYQIKTFLTGHSHYLVFQKSRPGNSLSH
jgi:SAM-dependent methyltransferase